MEEQIYISINPTIYRKNKSNILLSQSDLLQIIKKLHNLRTLSVQRSELKNELKKLIISTISKINALQEKMPNPKLPKRLIKHEKVISSKKVPNKKTMEIDEELQAIREKLRELNS